MRLLVLDGSRMLPSVVRRLVPAGVEIEAASTFDEALTILRLDPPQGMIVNLGPADLPWGDVQRLCHEHQPEIPVLFESCIHTCPRDAGLADLDPSAAFLAKPYSLADLKLQIERMLEAAGEPGATAAATGDPAQPALARRDSARKLH